MSTRGWEHVTAAQVSARAVKRRKPSKYRNVKTTLDGEIFDSKREAEYWLLLQTRKRDGELIYLHRQVPFGLYGRSGVQVAIYIADFVYRDLNQKEHVVDVKSKATRTAVYQLKKQLLKAQGIEIEEV